MDEEFTYKDRITFYKKDMWKSNLVYQTLMEELTEAKESGKDYLRVGKREIKIEGIEAFIKCQNAEGILHDRMRAAAALLNLPNPSEVYFLDADEDAEKKRLAEEKAWLDQREKEYQESLRKENEST
jgi:hypothetical protein